LPQDTIDINRVLVDRCRKGDSKAQYELYNAYAKAMYNVSLRIVNNIREAEDILQESFIEAFGKLNEFRHESTFGAWLKRIVVNRSVNYLKKRKLVLVEQVPDTERIEQETYTDDEKTQWNIAKIYQSINMLPDGYRLVLSLYLLEGYDHSEIAQVLNITESTSKSQYNRAKTRLRELLTN
jgi:RNA polymerase sigma factor (sigma-70 family)